MAQDPIKISATGVAEFIISNPSSRRSKLRPYKFNKRREGFGRSSYYQATINCITKYIQSGGDENAIKKAISELAVISSDKSVEKLLQIRAQRNIDAIVAYKRIYGRRRSAA